MIARAQPYMSPTRVSGSAQTGKFTLLDQPVIGLARAIGADVALQCPGPPNRLQALVNARNAVS